VIDKKERKSRILAEVKADKLKRKARKIELAVMTKEEQIEARKSDRKAKKAAQKERNAEIKKMPKQERKAAKKYDKIFRKIKNRPRRAIIWGAVACLFIFGIYQVIPIIGGFLSVASLPVDSDTAQGVAARIHAASVAEQISNEGIVLLKNVDSFLPLDESRINVFGIASFSMRYGGAGSGGADQTAAVSLYEGLSNAGIQYNRDLYDFTKKHADHSGGGNWIIDIFRTMIFGRDHDEPDIAYLTDDEILRARNYSPTAMIVLASQGVEMADFTIDELQLSQNKRDLLELVTANFDNVIIVINSGNPLELGFLEEHPEIKSALWIGTPGPFGSNSLANILVGNVNPSGRLVNTYAYDISSNPAVVNFGDYKYDNIRGRAFLNYEESIYIGYRFYETYYAEDEAGYNRAVQFPFGFGLSYTDFEWAVTGTNADADNIKIEVRVTNAGDFAGKDVVQVYFSAPYTQGGIEKSAIELAGYAKTGLLAPGESETVTVEFVTRDMASYDHRIRQAFILEAGTYEIKIAQNVRDIVDSFTFDVETTIIYSEDAVTGTAVQNHFDYANGGLRYLSRNDWAGTFPDASTRNHTAPQNVIDELNARPPRVDGPVPKTDEDNGIKLIDMKGLDYDDPKWETFLDQFTVQEMGELVMRGAYRTVAVDRLGIPEMVLLDGPAGINSLFSALTAAAYPTEIVVASTWNDELSYAWGEAIGREARAYGVHGWYAPAMNIHRTPLGGRNFEYFSEDPLISGKMSAAATRGAQSHNIIVTMKHFALNEQEVNARSGVLVWANEQAIREIYLRPFEITVKEGDVTGVMSSFIIIGTKWSGGNPELLQNVLRDEWGFVGVVTTDAVLGGWMDVNHAIRSGNDLMLAMLVTRSSMREIDRLYKEDPVGIAQALRNSTHNLCYSFVNYTYVFE